MSEIKNQIAIADGLFSWPSSDPHLIASKCKTCGDVFFPSTDFCANPNCSGEEVEFIQLSNKGKVWSYSIQYYPPPKPFKPADPYVPFGIVAVEFPEGVRIYGQLVSADPEKDIKLGMEVDTIFEKLDEDEEGNDVISWKFKPVK